MPCIARWRSRWGLRDERDGGFLWRGDEDRLVSGVRWRLICEGGEDRLAVVVGEEEKNLIEGEVAAPGEGEESEMAGSVGMERL